jgi:hypothetical protein
MLSSSRSTLSLPSFGPTAVWPAQQLRFRSDQQTSMRKRRARARRLRNGSTNRTGEKAWLQLSCEEYAPLAAENNRKISANRGLMINLPKGNAPGAGD